MINLYIKDMLQKYIRNMKLSITFITLAIACVCMSISAGEKIKRERPGRLFSLSKIPLLEDPGRDAWQKPEQIFDALKIEKGQHIGDIGAGSGYLTIKLAERTGTTGTVYAVDIQQDMLDYIKHRLTEKGLKNVVLVLGDMNDPKLPPESLDTAILLSIYHEIVKPVDFIKKLKPVLKPNGKLAILEFGDESPIGPPLYFRLPEDVIIDEVTAAGFTLSQRHTFLLPYQYLLVFTLSH
ncbi:MAG: class I SAM-dependent methyltransferase [wastewater metagenome]|nr:class I SAM-dependent methyltransferase [Candidatus Loosdrechtia aerotolerans]